MEKKTEDIKDLDITECLADHCVNDLGGEFWKNFDKINIDDIKSNDFSIYYNAGKYSSEYSLPDPDACSERLYEFHGVLWNKQRSEFLSLKIPNVVICQKSIWFKLNNKNITLGSDSIMSIYWHRVSEYISNVMKQIKEDIENKEKHKKICPEIEEKKYKDFIKDYLEQANTIGGFVLFPRHNNSINQQRGKRPIDDRFDLTLECIRRAYQYRDFYREDNNPLFGLSEEDKEFFRMFGSFEKYAEFFCLNESYDGKYNWVENGKVLNLLYDDENENKTGRNVKTLNEWDFSQEPLPQDSDEWWTFYRNIMNRLDARNQQIKEIIERK